MWNCLVGIAWVHLCGIYMKLWIELRIELESELEVSNCTGIELRYE